jgi:hypothetical protein
VSLLQLAEGLQLWLHLAHLRLLRGWVMALLLLLLHRLEWCRVWMCCQTFAVIVDVDRQHWGFAKAVAHVG